MRKLLAIVSALPLALVACGDSDDDSASDTTATTTTTAAPQTTAPETTRATTSTAAPQTTAPETTAPGTTAPGTTAGGGTTAAPDDGEAVAVELSEWMVDMPTALAAGPTELAVTNDGEFTHELLVVRGTSYDDLPQLANGAVDEDALGDDVIGRADPVDPGASMTASFDLAAGDYVFLCNINVGPNSHAAQGQVLSVTVG